MTASDHLFFSPHESAMEKVRRDVGDMLTDYHNNRPRNLQTALGPSEVGHPCARKLALSLMREPASNPDGDPLPSFVGTEAHAGYADAAAYANEKLGRVRWLAETRVTVRPGLTGSCDLIDTDTWTIIDHKFLSNDRLKKFYASMPWGYRRQVHLYGRGARNIGFPIEHVAVHMLPRGGLLTGRELWSEPYSDETVDDTLQRLDDITLNLDTFDVEAHPENYRFFPATPDTDCRYCPFHVSDALTVYQCDGKNLGTQLPIV